MPDRIIYCPQCGNALTVATEFMNVAMECPHCANVFTPAGPVYGPQPPFGQDIQLDGYGKPLKSKTTAGVLGILLGGFGVHRFYLGHIGVGVLQLLVTLCGCVVCIPIGCIPVPAGPLWGFIEGILCLTGHMKDAQGRELAD